VYDHERLNSIDNKINASNKHIDSKRKEKKKKNEIKGATDSKNLKPKEKRSSPGKQRSFRTFISRFRIIWICSPSVLPCIPNAAPCLRLPHEPRLTEAFVAGAFSSTVSETGRGED
jgi:hypothetical protein